MNSLIKDYIIVVAVDLLIVTIYCECNLLIAKMEGELFDTFCKNIL